MFYHECPEEEYWSQKEVVDITALILQQRTVWGEAAKDDSWGI